MTTAPRLGLLVHEFLGGAVELGHPRLVQERRLVALGREREPVARRRGARPLEGTQRLALLQRLPLGLAQRDLGPEPPSARPASALGFGHGQGEALARDLDLSVEAAPLLVGGGEPLGQRRHPPRLEPLMPLALGLEPGEPRPEPLGDALAGGSQSLGAQLPRDQRERRAALHRRALGDVEPRHHTALWRQHPDDPRLGHERARDVECSLARWRMGKAT